MIHRLVLVVLATGLLGSLRSATAQPAEPSVQLYDYTVKRGDSCLGIAIRELGDRKAYREIHKHNPRLGPLPHKLKPGSILRLPRKGPPVPDANLSARRGTVEFRKAQAASWAIAAAGMDLFRRWRVSSKKSSTAEITFRDTSRLRMRENTIVIIYGPSSKRARRRASRAVLEHGELRTRLAELDGKSAPLLVETNSSDILLEAGMALISVDAKSTSRLSNHSGKPAKVRSKKKRRRRAVAVASGFGSKVEADKDPTPPKPLPPTPVWQPGPDDFVGWGHSGATLRGAWAAVAGVASYRIEIARDAAGSDVVAVVNAPAQATAFEAHGFPAGTYHVSIAARDADQFESAPSTKRVLTSHAVEITPLGQTAPLAPLAIADGLIEAAAPVAPTVLPGAAIAPRNADSELRCTPEALTTSGAVDVTCSLAGAALPALPVTVAAVRSTAALAGARPAIPRGEPIDLVIELASEGAEVDASLATVEVGGVLELLEKRASGSQLTLRVRVRENAEGAASVTVSFGGTAPVIHPIAVEPRVVKAPPPPPAPPHRPWSLGILVGHTLVDDELNLGNAASADGVLDDGVITGIRAGRDLGRRLTLELEGTYSEPGFAGLDEHANIIGLRVHGLAYLLDGSIRPFVTGGVGAQLIQTTAASVESETDLEAYWGLGGKAKVTDRASIRLELRHRVMDGRTSRTSNLFEAVAGLSWAL